MSVAVALAALAAVFAVLAAWEAIAAAEQERLVHAAARWLAPALEILRSGREPTDPERRRLVALGALSLLGAGWLVAGPWIGTALGSAAPWVARAVLRLRRRRRQAAVAAQAPAMARALADALAGGHSVRGAIGAAAYGGGVPGPAGEELRAAAARLELGERTEDVLRALARDSGAGAVDTLVAAMLLQRDAGGNLAELLRSLARALEERGRAAADARSATAQARLTAWIVTGMPLGGIVLGELAQPGFIAGLVCSPAPALLAGTAMVLQAVALVCVRRIARIGEPC
jgi:tight adherence protein B